MVVANILLINCSDHVKNGNLIVFLVTIALTMLTDVNLLLCQCGSNLIITLGTRGLSTPYHYTLHTIITLHEQMDTH